MSEHNCKDCMAMGQQLELARQEIEQLRAAIVALERDVMEDMRAAYAQGKEDSSAGEL